MRKKLYFTFLAAFSVITAFAQIELSDVEITANTHALYSDLGRKLTVIEHEEIKKMAVNNVDDLLESISGLDIRQRGVGGTQADISIRGGSYNQVLILLNGVNITDPQTGHYNLDIPVEVADIVRVEVLQGSSARLLGANAFSGAINIITKKGDVNELNSAITAGSFGTLSQSVSGGFKAKNFRSFASVSHGSSDGYIKNTDYEKTNALTNFSLDNAVIGNLNLQMGAQIKNYGAHAFYSFMYPNQFDATKTYFSSLNWLRDKNKLKTEAQVYYRRHHDRFELFRNYEGSEVYSWYKGHNYHQTDVVGGKAVASYNSSEWGKFSLGLDIRNEHIFSNVLGKPMDQPKAVPNEEGTFFTYEDNRLLSTAFFDYAKTWKKWYLSVGVAATHSTEFNTNSYGGFDLAYTINRSSKAYVGFNSAVRLPSFTDLYYKSATELANPDLLPEHAYTPEIGLKINKSNWNAEVVGFYRMSKNVIDWVKHADSIKWQSENLTDVNTLGFDLSVEYKFNTSIFQNVKFQYSFLNMDKNAENFESKYALDYLRNKVVLSVGHTVWSKLTAKWNFALFDRVGTYTDFTTAQLTTFKPYFMADTRLMWTEKQFNIFADFNNILDVKYEDYGGLIQPGFNFNVGIRMSL